MSTENTKPTRVVHLPTELRNNRASLVLTQGALGEIQTVGFKMDDKIYTPAAQATGLKVAIRPEDIARIEVIKELDAADRQHYKQVQQPVRVAHYLQMRAERGLNNG